MPGYSGALATFLGDPPWFLQSPVVVRAQAVRMLGLNRRQSGSYLGRVPAGHNHVFTTASFEYNYRSPIFANKLPVAEFMKLPEVLSSHFAIKLRLLPTSNFEI